MRTVSRPPNDRRRMGDLACLPVFFTLTGKSVLVAGGSEAAAWKAELLAAAGAQVHVYADEDETIVEMRALADAGIVALHDSSWADADWAMMTLAVGDCGEKEARDLVARACAEGVPVNVIDKPDFCQFQFGSIVNRSPLVVGISTNGAAPILGQAVRRRIETLLPKSLAAWAHIARTVRARVTETLAPGAERRAFWERLADYAFWATPGDNAVESWIKDAKAAPQGRVTLVGAGPGDADDLTIKAVRALQAADVILFDDCVSDEVLERARREAKRVGVNGRAGAQTETRAYVGQGLHVVRLVAGNPVGCPRVGAEIAALEAEGTSLEVVPGIDAAPVRNAARAIA